MQPVEVTAWIAAGVTIIAAGAAVWQLWLANRRSRQAEHLASRVRDLATTTEEHASQSARAAEGAQSHARWAWEQVKQASNQLGEAQQEHRASTQREQWEWAHAMTTTARELLDSSQELLRIGLDAHVAPHYRMATQRHYQQVCQWWQETVTKALARTSPTLEFQQQVITFTGVHHRLHGHIGVLLRAAETQPLGDDDPLARQALHTGQELAAAHRQLQRVVSASLTQTGEPYAAPTQQAAPGSSNSAPPEALSNARRRGIGRGSAGPRTETQQANNHWNGRSASPGS